MKKDSIVLLHLSGYLADERSRFPQGDEGNDADNAGGETELITRASSLL